MLKKTTIHTPFGVFRTREAIKDHIRGWLYAFKPDDAITDPEIVAGLEFLIRQRKSKMMEIGNRKITGWTIEGNNAGTQCFAAVLDDGTQLHFSFGTAVKRLFENASEHA